ncbi:ATP-binding cassette domain-containing protein [Stackebrandtia nassauensis]|uniref:UvrABC system protein A n=1 Tax=Stackebrandtia nassauensis (strain DSM 44728 / CIP 108903 / NRRL B-16338 / NBRC 102104 / LLR-40K-21) TaxID=446470 RepID=D3PYZ8_STANL|nr:excinuclease ABC subunit UvrA [Stackebrandtia nassauensis]ADD45427.1 ABC transporter related protein [Stackebrandtia nassauensis DSM 44728]
MHSGSTSIDITGARENNLKNIDITIPKHRITVFTGVSGSGKSSIVFDTVAAEAQRQINETHSAFVRGFLPKYGQPDADAIENLSAAIIIDQQRLGGNSRSTVGTITDIYTLLRLLYSRVGSPNIGGAYVFSFNDPAGMCERCQGLGRVVTVDMDEFVDMSKSLNEGALLHPDFKVGKWFWNMYSASGFFDMDKPLAEYGKEELDILFHGTDAKIPFAWEGGTINSKYEGAVEKFTRLIMSKSAEEMSDRNRAIFERFTTTGVCDACEGLRLNEKVRSCKLAGLHIAEMASMEITDLVRVLSGVDGGSSQRVLDSLLERLDHLITIGLGYLSLHRATGSLSGGESQRIKTVRNLNSSLTEMMYIFDEPSIGLHARDVHRMNELLVKLRDKGNTVLVVEHDPDVIAVADHVIDVGPGAGTHGGTIVYEGPVAGLKEADTPTGAQLRRRSGLKDETRAANGKYPVADVNSHNVSGVSVDFPAGVLTVVTGVAGSGKSTLVTEGLLTQHPDAIVIDQTAVAANRRSNTATYTGLADGIRKLFANVNGVKPSLFSFNSDGACPDCQGHGVIYTDLAFMDGVKTPCETCEGKRFKSEVLAHTVRGKNISDVLNLTAEEAAEFFTEKKLRTVLRALNDVGLDYLTLGQPLNTLSGGECQRIKLATELSSMYSQASPAPTGSIGSGARASSFSARLNRLYVMDEPTTGLHMSDIEKLLGLFDHLVDSGNTVIIIEHNMDVIKHADWIIDLGPDGGSSGGRVMFEGTPRQLLDTRGSHTGDFLRRELAA